MRSTLPRPTTGGEDGIPLGDGALRLTDRPLGQLALAVRGDGIAHHKGKAVAQLGNVGRGAGILQRFIIAEALVDTFELRLGHTAEVHAALADVALAGDDVNVKALRLYFSQLCGNRLVRVSITVIGDIARHEQHIRVAGHDLRECGIEQRCALGDHQAVRVRAIRLVANIRNRSDLDRAVTHRAGDKSSLYTPKQHHRGKANAQHTFAFLQIYTSEIIFLGA